MRKFVTLMPTVLAMLCVFANPAFAGRPLTVEEMKSLFSGNTIHAYSHKKEYLFVIYFAPDGISYHTDMKGNPYTGKWWIDDKANHCTESKNFSGCYPIHDNGGVYQKYDGDTIIYTVKKIESGNTK